MQKLPLIAILLNNLLMNYADDPFHKGKPYSYLKDERNPEVILRNIFLAAKSSSSRLCNVWCVSVCPHQSSHTCPEALIKLIELVNKYLLQIGLFYRTVKIENMAKLDLRYYIVKLR